MLCMVIFSFVFITWNFKMQRSRLFGTVSIYGIPTPTPFSRAPMARAKKGSPFMPKA